MAVAKTKPASARRAEKPKSDPAPGEFSKEQELHA